MNGRKSGFTLIEVIMVVALVGILSFIAYPKYSEHVIKVRRSVMVMALMDLAGHMEKHYLEHNTYKGALDDLSGNDVQYKNYYRLDKKIDNDKYILYAVPINGQAKDRLCGSLSIDQDGNKGVTGDGGIMQCLN